MKILAKHNNTIFWKTQTQNMGTELILPTCRIFIYFYFIINLLFYY